MVTSRTANHDGQAEQAVPSEPSDNWRTHYEACKAAFQMAQDERNGAKRAKHLNAALSASRATLERFPTYLPAKAYEARCLSELGDSNGALAAFDRLREMFLVNSQRTAEWARDCFQAAMYRAARAALANGNPDQSIGYLEDALELEPVSQPAIAREWFFYLYAKALAAKQNHEGTIEYLTHVWQLGCRKDYVYRELAVAFLALRDFDRASQCMAGMSKRDQSSAVNLLISARIARLRRDFDTASKLLDSAIRTSPSKSMHKMLYEQGLLARDSNDMHQAIEYFEQANKAKLRAFDATYQDALKEIYLLKRAQTE